MNRTLLKKQAKKALKGKMGPFILVFIIFFCIELVIVSPFTGAIILEEDFDSVSSSSFMIFILSYLLIMAFMIVAVPVFTMTFIKGITKAAELPESEKFTFKTIWGGLKGSSCGIGNCWWTALWTFIWEFLCLLPIILLLFIIFVTGNEDDDSYNFIIGLVAIISYCAAVFAIMNRSIAYSMNWFVLAKTPDVGVVEAMNISKKITKGHKLELFGLYLSFICWFILSVLTFGLLLLWVMPFYCMTQYNAFKYFSEEYNKSNNESLSSNTDDSDNPYFASNLIPSQKPETEE